MIYKRLYNGNVVLRSLCGASPHPLDPAAAATAVASQLHQGILHADRVWDLAHLLKQHAQQAVEAAAAAAAKASASAPSPASVPASAATSPTAAGERPAPEQDQQLPQDTAQQGNGEGEKAKPVSQLQVLAQLVSVTKAP